MNKILSLILLCVSIFAYPQTPISGYIQEVQYTQETGIFLTIKNNATGEVTKVSTPKYIRGQKEFLINNGQNVIPPPLHVTDIWSSGYDIYVATSEPTYLTIYLREHRWWGTDAEWSSSTLPTMKEFHSIGIPKEFNLGINWAWDMIALVKNSAGQEVYSEQITFKTN